MKVFADPTVQSNLKTILFIWAKHNMDYKYQQGMNEILAITFLCLVSELVFEGDCTIFNEMHNPMHVFADCYCLFESLMNLAVKNLYYRN